MQYFWNKTTIFPVRLKNYCSIFLDTFYKYSCYIPSNDQAIPLRCYNKIFHEVLPNIFTIFLA